MWAVVNPDGKVINLLDDGRMARSETSRLNRLIDERVAYNTRYDEAVRRGARNRLACHKSQGKSRREWETSPEKDRLKTQPRDSGGHFLPRGKRA